MAPLYPMTGSGRRRGSFTLNIPTTISGPQGPTGQVANASMLQTAEIATDRDPRSSTDEQETQLNGGQRCRNRTVTTSTPFVRSY
jgi:hypothetical protein